MPKPSRLGFLSSAPRISTHPDAEMSGPRSRVLGVIKGFESLGWDIETFIVGDRTPQKWSAKGSEKAMGGNFLKRLAIDFVRLFLGTFNSWRSWSSLRGKVDFVYEYAATLQSLGWIFKRHGIPWILQTEAILFYEAKVERQALVLNRLAKWMELRAYRKCDVLACISTALKETLIDDYGISPHKIVLVPNGVDTDFINPKLHMAHRVSDSFTIGFVGSLYAWAGLDLLLQALHDLKREGHDFSLAVVGDGVMRSDLEKQTYELNLSSQVTFAGRVPWAEVPKYIGGFDIAYSGQLPLQMGKMYLSPMKLYEYMAMAKPVVASAFEDAKRLIVENQTGFLFQPGNLHDLKRALLKAFDNQSRFREMGHSARLEIEKYHSWQARVQVLVEESERILSASGKY